MKLYVKYMVSLRCKMAVKSALEEIGMPYGAIDLGEINLKSVPTEEKLGQLKKNLLKHGLELMEDKKAVLIEKLKTLVIEMIYFEEGYNAIKHSDYISDNLKQKYTYLADLFSEATGLTLENYIIAKKTERVKELLLYDELTITEIAYRMNYSSVAHLSAQFKKATGLTPTFFKNLKDKKRMLPEAL